MYIVESKFGTLAFEGDFVIATINSEVNVGKETVNWAIKHVNQKFANQSYCYIDNHLNDYSIDPIETERLFAETPLKAYAIVVSSPFSLQNLFMEKLFYTAPVLIASSINDAKEKLQPFF